MPSLRSSTDTQIQNEWFFLSQVLTKKKLNKRKWFVGNPLIFPRILPTQISRFHDGKVKRYGFGFSLSATTGIADMQSEGDDFMVS